MRPLRGGRRARSLYCKPSEQRGNGEEDDDGGDEDDEDNASERSGVGEREARTEDGQERGAIEWEATRA